MTAHKIVILACHTCGATSLPGTMTVQEVIRMKDPLISVSDARRDAHAKGWRHTASGKDLCPLHAPTPGPSLLAHIPHQLFHGRRG